MEKGKGKVEGKKLRNVGRTDTGDFILCPMLCIALDGQLYTMYISPQPKCVVTL